MDMASFVAQLRRDGSFDYLVGDAAMQFGMGARRYLGATLLPERQTMTNMYTESGIRSTTIIANDGSRYSPVQKKAGGVMVGTFDVKLGDQSIGAEFTARDYDAVLELLMRAGGGAIAMEGAANRVLDWANVALNLALIELAEKQRWDAIVDASVVRSGDNGYTETVSYPNPSGHRVAAGGTWSSDAYDPFPDIVAQVDLLADKGYRATRMVCSTAVLRILQRNMKMATRNAPVRVLTASDIVNRQSIADLNAGLQANGLPPIETYDLTYRDATGRQRFLDPATLVILAETGRDETIEVADGVRYLPDTLGYTAIGRTPGAATPGRVMNVDYDDDPPHLEGKARQTSLPVVTEPDAIATIHTIA
jgi:hypothetical protein